MDNGAETLRKMIALGRDGGVSPLEQATEVAGASIGRTARQLYDVEADFDAPNAVELTLQEVLAGVPDPGLLFVVGIGAEQKGLLCLDGLLINALIEVMTGAQDNQVFREARAPTNVDAVLSQDFCTAFLERFSSAFAEISDLPDLTLLQSETDARKLAFVLDKAGYGVIGGTVSFQAGIRGGALSLALPMTVWAGGSVQHDPAVDPDWSKRLRENVMASPLGMRAVLETLNLPLGQALSLSAGDELPISAAALSDITLVSTDGIGRYQGRLGQVNGRKAVCISGVVTKSGVVSGESLTPPTPKSLAGGGPAGAGSEDRNRHDGLSSASPERWDTSDRDPSLVNDGALVSPGLDASEDRI